MNKDDLVKTVSDNITDILDDDTLRPHEKKHLVKDSIRNAIQFTENNVQEASSEMDLSAFDHYAGLSFRERLRQNFPAQKEKIDDIAKASLNDAEVVVSERKKYLKELDQAKMDKKDPQNDGRVRPDAPEPELEPELEQDLELDSENEDPFPDPSSDDESLFTDEEGNS